MHFQISQVALTSIINNASNFFEDFSFLSILIIYFFNYNDQQGFKKFRKYIRVSFLNFYELYSLNIAENVNFINKVLEEVSLTYFNFISESQSQNINIKFYQQTLNKMVMLYCLITHTILNNAGNDRSIHYDSPSDEQTDVQGKILATCIKLIEFDINCAYNNVKLEFYMIL